LVGKESAGNHTENKTGKEGPTMKIIAFYIGKPQIPLALLAAIPAPVLPIPDWWPTEIVGKITGFVIKQSLELVKWGFEQPMPDVWTDTVGKAIQEVGQKLGG
jgi:hypothetical protein